MLSGAGPFGFEGRSSDGSGGEDDGPMVVPTKGSHIIVDPFPGASKNAIYVEARKDG